MPEAAAAWLILADRQGLAQGLAERLRQRQQECVLLEPGDDYALLDNGHYQVPIEDLPAWERLLREALPTELPLRGVVHLWSLDTQALDLAPATHLACGSALSLVQTLRAHDRLPRDGLWLVTAGARPRVANGNSAWRQRRCGAWGRSSPWSTRNWLADCSIFRRSSPSGSWISSRPNSSLPMPRTNSRCATASAMRPDWCVSTTCGIV